ncbi:hypothetical protein LEMLEM_LOCUS22782, partial [Lemmus lemmus]
PQGGLADQNTLPVTDSIPAARTTVNEVVTPPPGDHTQVTASPDHREAWERSPRDLLKFWQLSVNIHAWMIKLPAHNAVSFMPLAAPRPNEEHYGRVSQVTSGGWPSQ